GVKRPAMAEPDAELHQPDRQHAVAPLAIGKAAPRRTIVGQNAVRQAVLAKDRGQRRTYRRLAFIAARHDAERIARVIVDHGQRVATARRHRKMPFDVHLPQLVRRLALEALPRLVLLALRDVDQSMALQNLSDRARTWNLAQTLVVQPPLDLAATPRRMLRTHRQHRRLHRRRRLIGRAMRPSRPLRQSSLAFRSPALPALITRRRSDPKPTAQLAPVGSFLVEQPHKLSAHG